MLDDMTRLALKALGLLAAGLLPDGRGASIDKRAHDADAERTVWHTIEFDNAVAVALEFARRTKSDADPANDTLVTVTADHECGGLALVGVGNERYSPQRTNAALRDYAAVFRFKAEQTLELVPNYVPGPGGFPVHPDPSRKLLLAWAGGPGPLRELAVATDGQLESSSASRWSTENQHGESRRVTAIGRRATTRRSRESACPVFLGSRRHREWCGRLSRGCPAVPPIPARLRRHISGHTASDVPLSATGPGAWQFTGVFENTDVFLKMLRAVSGTYRAPGSR